MKKENILDFLFEMKKEYNEFDEEDNQLVKYHKELSEKSDKLYEFINTKFCPKYQEEIKELIDSKYSAQNLYYSREGQIYYKSGFTDALYLILSIFFYNKL